jgi:hypothetical protein
MPPKGSPPWRDGMSQGRPAMGLALLELVLLRYLTAKDQVVFDVVCIEPYLNKVENYPVNQSESS